MNRLLLIVGVVLLLFHCFCCEKQASQESDGSKPHSTSRQPSLTKDVRGVSRNSALDFFMKIINSPLYNTTAGVQQTDRKRVNCSLSILPQAQVKVINSSSLVSYLGEGGNNSNQCSIVLFYTPWCRFSAAAAPHFNALARVFPHINMLAVDASSNYHINTQYGVMGVPTVLLFHHGRPMARFNDSAYTLQNFADFITHHTGKSPSVLLNVTTQDFYGPLPSTPTEERDPWLWASWIFLILLSGYMLGRSHLALQFTELIRRTWREAEGLHEHTD